MVIAHFAGEGTAQGKEITCMGGAYRTSDDEIVTYARLLELDRNGEIEWVDARMRAWVLALPEDAPESCPPGMWRGQQYGGAARGRTSLTGEQLRIVTYILVGLIAVALLVIYGRGTAETTPVVAPAGPGGWVQLAAQQGIGEMLSQPVTIQGVQQRLEWSVSGGEGIRVRFCLVPVDAQQPPGDFVVLDTLAAGTGSAVLRAPPGDYSVVVLSTDDSWSFTLSDDRGK